MFYILVLIAILLVVLEIIAAKKNKYSHVSGNITDKWLIVYKWRYLLGLPFAVASFFVSYTMSGDTEPYKVMGFPLMAAAFDDAGRDYVGPLTVPFFFINAVIWYFLPFLILLLWSYINTKKQKNI